MQHNEIFLLYMLIAARRIIRSTSVVSRVEFDADDEKRDSVVLQLGNIGEAARRISEAFQHDHPDVPWSDIIGMRHRIFHAYEEVDWDIVWTAATMEVPRLIRLIEPLVPPEEGLK